MTAVRINGDDAATAISFDTAGGPSETIDTAHVFLHQGVIPNINLTMATGLDHVWDRGHLRLQLHLPGKQLARKMLEKQREIADIVKAKL